MEDTEQISMGDIYSINQQVYAKLPVLPIKDVITKLKPIVSWLEERQCKYTMLLCRELNNYTVLHYNSDNYTVPTLTDLRECIENRGRVIDIEYNEPQDAWEIWMKIGTEVHMYMFFDAEDFVVEV